MWAEDEFDLEEILLQSDDAKSQIQKALVEGSQNNNGDRVSEIMGNPEALAIIDINEVDEAGSTPLLYACCYSSENAVIELLRNGADVNAVDSNEWSPLMWAVQNNSLPIVERLVEQGANVGYKTSTGRSATSMCLQGSAVFQYFASRQLIDDTGPSFYTAATDPTDEEAQFQEKLDASSRALGIEFQGLEEAPLPLLEEQQDDFEWNINHQQFPVPPRLFPQLLDLVVTDIVPFQKSGQPVAANTLYLTIRYYCYQPNEQALVGLVSSVIQRITKVAQTEDLKALTYWLVNVHALWFYLQRDTRANSETASFQESLKNLLLSLYDRILEIAKQLIRPLIKPCILDYENIPGIASIKYRGDWSLWRKRESPVDDTPDILPPSWDALRQPAPRRITSILSSLLLVLQMYSVHPVLVHSLYSQLLYWLGATLFNAILKNHKYMARVRAMQIRLNISNLEDWALNNNTRPQDDELHQGPPTYKSLDQLCRMHFSCVAEMLQWLQCFSGFGTDFTNVIATMQELRELNPKQLLFAAKNYRSEINEPSLSKEYKEYLQDLEHHYESTGDHSRKESKDMILLNTPPLVSADIYLDAAEELDVHLPSFQEMLWFWGGGSDGTEVTSGHYFKPSVPAEISDALDVVESKEMNIYDPLEMPSLASGRGNWE